MGITLRDLILADDSWLRDALNKSCNVGILEKADPAATDLIDSISKKHDWKDVMPKDEMVQILYAHDVTHCTRMESEGSGSNRLTDSIPEAAGDGEAKKIQPCHNCGYLNAPGTISCFKCDTFLIEGDGHTATVKDCLLYTSPSPRDATLSRMPSSA